MKTLWRNQRTIYYCLYQGNVPIYDEFGNETGETRVSYGEATALRANVSAATGSAQVEQFGNLDSYDKVIVTDWMDCPIDENSVLFIDKAPEFTEQEFYTVTRAEDITGETVTVGTETAKTPLYDYTVRRVAKSLNSVSIAVRKVNVS